MAARLTNVLTNWLTTVDRVPHQGIGGQQHDGSFVKLSDFLVADLRGGLRSPPVPAIETGSSWSWSGEAVALDLPDGADAPPSAETFRRHAVRAVRQLLGRVLPPVRPVNGCEFAEITLSRDFLVSCGRATYRVALVEVAEAARPLLLFTGQVPPRNRPLRIVEGLFPEARAQSPVPVLASVICFTPGTRLRTPAGAIPVEALREGDLVDTRDGGAQEILWIGQRRLSGAQMHALPELRPVRLRAGALGEDRPEADLVVSPRHRILLKGPAADALYGTPEVLVAAEDLLNDATVTRDTGLREVTYIHLLLPRHHVVWANGVETESFHPASTDLRTVDAQQFDRLARIVPGVEANPRGYGEPVRRELSRAEAQALAREVRRPH
jgi:hypothetical protein